LRTGPRPVTITTTADDGARPTSPCPPALACADFGIPHRARHVHLPISVATAELGGGSRGGGATAGVVGEGWGQRAQGWIGGAARSGVSRTARSATAGRSRRRSRRGRRAARSR